MSGKSKNEFTAYLGEALLKTLQTRVGALNPIIMDLRDQWIRIEYRELLKDGLTPEKAKSLLTEKTFFDENNNPYSLGYEAINKIIYRKNNETSD